MINDAVVDHSSDELEKEIVACLDFDNMFDQSAASDKNRY